MKRSIFFARLGALSTLPLIGPLATRIGTPAASVFGRTAYADVAMPIRPLAASWEGGVVPEGAQVSYQFGHIVSEEEAALIPDANGLVATASERIVGRVSPAVFVQAARDGFNHVWEFVKMPGEEAEHVFSAWLTHP